MSRLRVFLLFPVIALLSGLLAACGGGDGGGDKDPNRILEQTFKGKKDVKSAAIDLSFRLEGKGSPQLDKPVTLKLTGPFESQGEQKLPKFDLEVQASASGQSFNAGAVSTGRAGFVKFQGTNYALDENTFGMFRTAFENAQKTGSKDSDDSPGLATLGIDPTKWLKDLKHEGEENVGGADTDHLSAEIDVSALLTDLNSLFGKAKDLGLGAGQNVPTEIPADARRQIEQAVKEAKFDVWSGTDDRILRKLQLKLAFDVPKEARGDTGGLESGTIDLSFELGNLNGKQKIEAPKDTKPISELLNQLGGLGGLGALGGGSGSGPGDGSGGGAGDGSGSGGTPPSGGGAGAPSSKQTDEYVKCIQDAKGAAELQKCAEKLR